MRNHLRLVVLPLMLGLAACAAEYSKTEAPDTLRVDGAESRRELAFAAGSAYLSPAELRKLDGWVLSGAIRPADRVEVAPAGPPGLAERRAAAISRELLRYGLPVLPGKFTPHITCLRGVPEAPDTAPPLIEWP